MITKFTVRRYKVSKVGMEFTQSNSKRWTESEKERERAKKGNNWIKWKQIIFAWNRAHVLLSRISYSKSVFVCVCAYSWAENLTKTRRIARFNTISVWNGMRSRTRALSLSLAPTKHFRKFYFWIVAHIVSFDRKMNPNISTAVALVAVAGWWWWWQQKHKGQHQIKYLSVLAEIPFCNERKITTRIILFLCLCERTITGRVLISIYAMEFLLLASFWKIFFSSFKYCARFIILLWLYGQKDIYIRKFG